MLANTRVALYLVPNLVPLFAGWERREEWIDTEWACGTIEVYLFLALLFSE